MNLPPTLAHYQTLRRLRRMVMRSETAVLLYLWGDDPRSLDWLRRELDLGLRARARRVLHWRLADEAGFQAALAGVLAPEPGAQTFAAWVDLAAGPGNAALCDRWLARLNERRLQLLQWPRAVILCGPSALEARVGEVAPDLWSVRSASLQVPAWPAAPVDAVMDSTSLPTVEPSAYPGLWQAAWEAYNASQDPSAQLDLGLGLEAANALLGQHPADMAKRVLDQIEVLLPPDGVDDPGLLRWRLLHAQLLGRWHANSRRWLAASQCFGQALKVSERLVALTGESPGALRDWAVSLNKVGDVQRALGDMRGAKGRYEKSLEVSELLLGLTGESIEALRGWSVSLTNVGDVLRALGDVRGARERYEKSLNVCERLVAQMGESTEALRDWSVSLNKVGDVQRALGDVTGARGRYEESLKVRERLVALTGESPEALRDLAISLSRLGDVSLDAGETKRARAYFERELLAAQAALRQSPLSQDLQNLVAHASAGLAALPPVLP